ncbi:hypothetical protein [Nocardioides sp. GXZ039]|uniref:hypothetical protein n=1 Tax=Nocardioides sp. GXZ039 TaxID=3136018 RepID=UPI0030F412C3
MGYTPEETDEIYADIEALYRVGRITMPDQAEALSGAASRLSAAIDTMNSRAAQLGDPAITQNAMAVCSRVNNALVQAVSTMNDVAAGLVYVADDFVARDQTAQDAFNGLDKSLTTGQVTQATVPPTTDEDSLLDEGDGDDYTAVPDYQTPQDELDDLNEDLDDAQDDVDDLTDLPGVS